ncbi:FAD binding domain-containing protein [Thozetella sp. PMI_491]|nr:FAD binding domain-containing protein [Thozetella sp. PMI_491]
MLGYANAFWDPCTPRILSVLACVGLLVTAGAADTCRCLPEDDCWPSPAKWAALNASVDGSLFQVRPAGAPCFSTFNGQQNAEYSIAECDTVQKGWKDSNWIVEQQTEAFSDYWTNYTCDPTLTCSVSCNIGMHPQMVVMAQKVSDIQEAVRFAKDQNIRFVIRNTGHCYSGRSSGYGALAINTHGLDSVLFSAAHKGPGTWDGGTAIVGAGVMFRDLYPAAHKLGVDVVGGDYPTVGIAGGYIQGGGHSPLSGIYGMASDSALSFDVVTASGELVTANAANNTDLFWALKGGGMGTYGVVTSLTVKTYPSVIATGMTLNIVRPSRNDTNATEAYWTAIADFHSYGPVLAEAGMYVWYTITPGGLNVQPFVAPNRTVAEFEEILQPFIARLTSLDVTYEASAPAQYPSFYDLYTSLFALSDDVGTHTLIGGRLFKTADVTAGGAAIASAIRSLVEAGHTFGGRIVNPGRAVPDPTASISSVHPVWRDTSGVAQWVYNAGSCLSQVGRRAAAQYVTDMGEALRAVSPNSAVYVNEGDVNEPNWQEAFWGSNYRTLLRTKQRWDPDGVFWAKSTPGSERWVLRDERRLCKHLRDRRA